MLNKICFLLFLIGSFANAQNPYEQFGFDNTELEIEMEKLKSNNFILVNTDTTSNISALKFDFNVGKVIIVYNNGFAEEKLIPKEMVLRWLSVDPKADQFPHQSPYNSMSNNPINRIDPDGQADYYAKDGNHLGNDNVDDNRTMLSTGIKKDKDGNITFENPMDLKIGHDDFLKLSAISYGESGYKENKFSQPVRFMEKSAIASASLNYADNYFKGDLKEALTSSYAKALQHERAKDFINKSSNNHSSEMKLAVSATIYSLQRIHDYSNGASFWDGTDVLRGNPPSFNPKVHYRQQKSFDGTRQGIMANTVLSKQYYENVLHYHDNWSKVKPLIKAPHNTTNPLWRVTNVIGPTIFYEEIK